MLAWVPLAVQLAEAKPDGPHILAGLLIPFSDPEGVIRLRMGEDKELAGSAKNPIDVLAEKVGSEWRDLAKAREFTRKYRLQLRDELAELDTEDTSVVVFGSLARDEATSNSDVDWTLLVDGMADPQHLNVAHEISRRLAKIQAKPPGREGTFGNLAFSHEILHWIGGEDDSNANTTRRMLLLLESQPIGRAEAWDRVLNNVLRRYLTEDRGLWQRAKDRGVPLFLLNDIARFWRIMVVDFAYKQRTRGNRGYALRSIKLGLSRKLIYASGLLACFSCHFDFPEEHWGTLSTSGNPQLLIEHLRATFRKTPLEILATMLIRYDSLLEPVKRLFDAYDRFIGFMAEESPVFDAKSAREHLEELDVASLETDSVYGEAREIRRVFGKALTEVFLDPKSELYNATIRYGVF
jgi:predicted nucleotidyltransferase